MGSGGRKTEPAVLETTTAKSVLQVFHNVVCYGKEENNAAAREALCRWQETIMSLSGEARGQSLTLPEALLGDRPRFERSNLLILNDHNDAAATASLVPLHEEAGASGITLLQLSSRCIDYEIFNLSRGAAGLELHLAYSRHAAYIGAPRRNDYRLACLKPGDVLRVTINGKLDFSASGRRARSYQVRDYLIHHLGEFGSFSFLPETASPIRKRVPLQQARHVDLREILY